MTRIGIIRKIDTHEVVGEVLIELSAGAPPWGSDSMDHLQAEFNEAVKFESGMAAEIAHWRDGEPSIEDEQPEDNEL